MRKSRLSRRQLLVGCTALFGVMRGAHAGIPKPDRFIFPPVGAGKRNPFARKRLFTPTGSKTPKSKATGPKK